MIYQVVEPSMGNISRYIRYMIKSSQFWGHRRFVWVVCNIREEGILKPSMEFLEGIPKLHLIPCILRGFIVELKLPEVWRINWHSCICSWSIIVIEQCALGGHIADEHMCKEDLLAHFGTPIWHWHVAKYGLWLPFCRYRFKFEILTFKKRLDVYHGCGHGGRWSFGGPSAAAVGGEVSPLITGPARCAWGHHSNDRADDEEADLAAHVAARTTRYRRGLAFVWEVFKEIPRCRWAGEVPGLTWATVTTDEGNVMTMVRNPQKGVSVLYVLLMIIDCQLMSIVDIVGRE